MDGSGGMKHFIGIDGGGTHSRLLAVHPDGSLLGRARGGSTNLESNPADVVMANLNALVADFHREYKTGFSDCLGLCFGTAGVDNQATKRSVEELLKKTDFTCPAMVVNDANIALHANTGGGPGLMLISGTGSIAYGVNAQGAEKRVGGYGFLVGDECSGYWLASRGIREALHAHDGLRAPTSLMEGFTAALGLFEFEEILDFVYKGNKADMAQLSNVVARARDEGDAAAQEIFEEGLSYLRACVDQLVSDLGSEAMPLFLGGGLLTNNEFLRQSLAQHVARRHPQLDIRGMDRPAEWGAVVLAAKLAGHRLPMAAFPDEREP